MEIITQIMAKCGRFLLTLKIADFVDIAIMAVVIYYLLKLIKSTKTGNLFKGVVFFLLALWASNTFELQSIYFILSHTFEWGVLALIILFQPEIRRILEEMGSRQFRFFSFLSRDTRSTSLEQCIDQTVIACAEMAKSKTGVLLVFERSIALDDITRSGTLLDATVSSELLKNIFFVKAPMHDGAVIVRQGRLFSAGCMLPLSKNVNLSRDLGMRHRAGIGMSENSDAVVVIVSEETGTISVAIGGMLKRHLMPETLDKLLRNELIPKEEIETPKKKRGVNLKTLRRELKEKSDGK